MIALINEYINRIEEYLTTNNEQNAEGEYKTRLIKSRFFKYADTLHKEIERT